MPASTSLTAPYFDFTDLAGFVGLPRVTSLAVSPDGRRVVAAVQQPDEHGSTYVSALWELDPDGERAPRRITFSRKGEWAPRFTAEGSLLFISARPDTETSAAGADDSTDQAAVWALPGHGGPGSGPRHPAGWAWPGSPTTGQFSPRRACSPVARWPPTPSAARRARTAG